MIDCICQYGKNLSDEHEKCPYCGTDLKLLRKIKEFPCQYIEAGARMLEQGRIEEAVRYLETSISLNPKAAGAYKLLGDIFVKKGLYDEAVNYYDKALALDDGDQETIDAMAYAKEAKDKSIEDNQRRNKRNRLLKKMVIIIPAAAFIVGLAVLPAIAWLFPEETPVAAITEESIINELAGFDSLDGVQLTVDLEGDIYMVSGVVQNELQKTLISDLIENMVDRVNLQGVTIIEEETPDYDEDERPDLNEIAEEIAGSIKANEALEGIDITAEVSGETLVISGSVPSDIYSTLLNEIAGHITGDFKIDIDALTVEPEPQKVLYTVKPNDTLYTIAEAFYENGRLWPLIYDANRDLIDDPNIIRTGLVIEIPSESE
ncbi:MAG: tetratricopeptide repeat protein [Eubacteriales bacterium]|nr:tetratricopeptide repeat protein [Eubacteriales bacterium]